MNTANRVGMLAGSFLVVLLGAAGAGRCSGNLVFVRLEPCRVIDTRVSGAGGPLVGGKPRSFVLRGPHRNYQDPAPFPNQGGQAKGCGIPDLTSGSGRNAENAAKAVAITVELDTSAREVKAWPANQGELEAGTLGWLADTDPEVVPMCDEVAIKPCAGGDVTFQTRGNRHLVVNVVGYFRARSTAPAPSAGAGGNQALSSNATGSAREKRDMERLRNIARLGVTVYYPRTVPERFKLAEARAEMKGRSVDYELKYCDEKDLCFSIESAAGGIGDEWNNRELSGKSKIFGPFRVYVFLPREEGNDSPDTYYLSDWLLEERIRKKPRKDWAKEKNGRYYHLLGSGLKDREAVTVIESLAVLQ
ncbi:MAG TPA: hypothetical protein VJA16_16255 [Thermoanaerobaculia bacterium]